MGDYLSFQLLFSDLISELKASDKVVEVSHNFGPQKTLEEMFCYLWDLEEAQRCLAPTTALERKSDVESNALRAEGNKCYQKKYLDKAIKLYNLSIMSAPHPSLPEINTKNPTPDSKDNNAGEQEEYRSLSLGYANRSAVLIELEQYEKCICDIEAALRHGYPKLLHSKLAERKAKCLLALKRKTDAKEVLEKALQDLADLSLDESKSKTSRESLDNLLKHCESDEDGLQKSENSADVDLSVASKDKLLFAYSTPVAPKLADQNPTIPSLSGAVHVAYTPSQGRYLVAERDIYPGEVLVTETAYCNILHLDSSLRTHCSNCLSRCLTPIPCPTCIRVIFCSDSCRKEGLSTFHKQECYILPTLAALDMGKNSVLAYRILTQTTHKKLKAMMPELIHETENQSPEFRGYSPEGIYSSSNYKSIYHLVHNKDQRSVSDLFKRCAMAVTLTKLLVESQQYFVDDDGNDYMPTQEDLNLVGCTLFIHMMNLPCNAHSITELQVNVSRFQESATREIGSGAFGVLSLTNHSCNPATARSSYGNVNVLRAIRYIPRGAEVTDSYGEHYGIRSREARKTELMQQYCFTCTCEACMKNWVTYPSLSPNLTLRCLKCSKPVDVNKGKCKKCHIDYTKEECNENAAMLSYDCNKIDKEVKDAATKYESTYSSIIEGQNSKENVKVLINFIELVDKYVEHPCKLYFEAQETLKHCFDRQANCVYRKEEGEGRDIFKNKS